MTIIARKYELEAFPLLFQHGCYSRLPLFDLMEQYGGFLEGLVRSILEFVASKRVPFDLVSEASDGLSSHRGTVGKFNSLFAGSSISTVFHPND